MKRKQSKLGRWIGLIVLSMLMLTQPVWANDGVHQWAKDVMSPWNGGQKITKGEFSQILTSVFGLTRMEEAKSYDDIPAGYMYGDAIKKVSHKGWVSYTSKKFQPSKLVTREEVNYAFAKALGQSKFLQGDPKGAVTKAELGKALSKQFVSLIRKSGTYSKDLTGNVAINTTKVTLKDMTINGNLYILEGVGDLDGSVVLENVKVTGNTYTYNYTTGRLSVLGHTQLGTIQVMDTYKPSANTNFIKFVNSASHHQVESRTITITSPQKTLKRDTGSDGSITVSEKDGFKVGDRIQVSIQADGRTQTFEFPFKAGITVHSPALVEEEVYVAKGQVLVNGKPAPRALVGVNADLSSAEITRTQGINSMYADQNGYFSFEYILPYKKYELWARYETNGTDYQVELKDVPIGKEERFVLNLKPVTSVAFYVTNEATGNGLPNIGVTLKVGEWKSSTNTDSKGLVSSVGAIPMKAGDTIEIQIAGRDKIYTYTLKDGKNVLPTIAIKK